MTLYPCDAKVVLEDFSRWVKENQAPNWQCYFGWMICKDGFEGRGHIWLQNGIEYAFRRNPGRGRNKVVTLDKVCGMIFDEV